jgi:hypothetical protein
MRLKEKALAITSCVALIAGMVATPATPSSDVIPEVSGTTSGIEIGNTLPLRIDGTWYDLSD